MYFRAYCRDVLLGASGPALLDLGEAQTRIKVFTVCKSLFDHLTKEGAAPEDKQTADRIASLRGSVSAGPGRNTNKSECKWLPTHWQLADCLAKPGLHDVIELIFKNAATKLHGQSLQSIKREKSAHQCSLTYWSGLTSSSQFTCVGGRSFPASSCLLAAAKSNGAALHQGVPSHRLFQHGCGERSLH